MRDVAQVAGVSTKTASRVLNDHPSVAPDTRAAVLVAMEQLNYIPDTAARSLRVGVDRSVGVLIDSIGDVFFAQLAAAIEAELDKHGYRSLIVSSNRDVLREAEAVNMFVQRRCAGMIVAPLQADSLTTARIGNTPLVFVDRVGSVPGAQSVVVDDERLSREATSHLIKHGHQRIALITETQSIATTQHRHVGYRQAMAEHRVTVDEDLVCSDVNDSHDVIPVLERLLELEQPPTAILSTNARVLFGVLPALHQFGRTDIALVSFGDFALAESLSPAVSVIDHSPAAIGEAAVTALLPRLHGHPSEGEDIIYVPAQLITRGSGELRPRTDQGGS